MNKQIEYVVKLENFNFKTTVCYDENEYHSEESAIDYVLGNMMSDIRKQIAQQMFVDDIREA